MRFDLRGALEGVPAAGAVGDVDLGLEGKGRDAAADLVRRVVIVQRRGLRVDVAADQALRRAVARGAVAVPQRHWPADGGGRDPDAEEA